MSAAQASELRLHGAMIGLEVFPPSCGDLRRRQCVAGAIERLPVEGRGRTELRGGKARIERSAGGGAVGIDDRARDVCAYHGRADLSGKTVQPIDPPVRVLAR